MILSAEERRKFAQWLEQDIASTKAILKQMGSASLPTLALDGLTKQLMTEMLAEKIVLKKLASTESQTIGGG